MQYFKYTPFFLFYFPLFLFAQTKDAKRDYTWLLGYASNANPLSDNGNIKIDFNADSIKAVSHYTKMYLNSNAAMTCDTSGHLLFYTNGIYVADSTNQPMLGGEELLTDAFTLGQKKSGILHPQNSLILPCPDSDSLYYLIYKSLEYNSNQTDIICKNLYYAIVDMSQNNGKGKVIIKNQPLLSNVLQQVGNLTATRHANGRDWWLIINKAQSSEYIRFLVSRQGITKIGTKDLAPKVFSGLGQACFSPDGTKYAQVVGVTVTPPQYLELYDFDRCQGILSNHQQILLPDTILGSGVVFSPNSRFLYVTMWTRLYQYDMQAADIAASKDTVATYDKFKNPVLNNYTLFYLMQLAPDNKIYISVPSGSKYLHVIENPNIKGKACNVAQHSFLLPTYNANTMPNYPNFRLGKLEGVCDTIVAVAEQVGEQWEGKIYPNPSDALLTITNPTLDNDLRYELITMQGVVVSAGKLAGFSTTIEVGNLNAGMYLCKIIKGKVVAQTSKVVVLHR